MKIAVSSEDLNLEARVAQRFGISPYLIIVDPETMEFEAVPNPGAAGTDGGFYSRIREEKCRWKNACRPLLLQLHEVAEYLNS